MEVSDQDINLELKYYPSREELFSQERYREIIDMVSVRFSKQKHQVKQV